jgi:hypothetical protein
MAPVCVPTYSKPKQSLHDRLQAKSALHKIKMQPLPQQAVSNHGKKNAHDHGFRKYDPLAPKVQCKNGAWNKLLKVKVVYCLLFNC